ncbi:MAG: DUF308 domain-containing protein [Eubacteriales bacterium]|nr:DUF308 domain-containing protein [Eubacteriales bacterium]
MTKPFRKAMLITSVVYLIVGLVLIIWPDAARQIIIYAIGGAALLYGGYRIVDFFVRKEHLSGVVQIGIALGIACLLLGLFLLVQSALVVTLLSAIIGVAVIIDSVLRLQVALNMRHVGARYWLLLLVTALVTLGFGILLLFNPFTAVKVATIVGGVGLLLTGGFTLWGVLQAQSGGPQRTVSIR